MFPLFWLHTIQHNTVTFPPDLALRSEEASVLPVINDTLDKTVWGDQLYNSGRAGRILATLLRYLYGLMRDIIYGQLTLRSMSLVYTTLLSIVPLIAFSFSVLKGFGVHE